MSHYLYKKESYAIIGAAMEVYNQLGQGSWKSFIMMP